MTQLWAHQKQALSFVESRWGDSRPGVLLAMAMGLGKTAVAVHAVAGLARVLVVCPKSVAPVWPEQIARFWPAEPDEPFNNAREGFFFWGLHTRARGRVGTVSHAHALLKGSHKCSPPVLHICSLADGPVARRAGVLREALAQDGPLLAIVNYDSVWRGELGKVVSTTPWDCVVLDESHRIKAPGGVASRFLARVGAKARSRLALTGTPLPQSHLDAYGQMRFLDPTVFGPSYAAFRDRYTRSAASWEGGRPDAQFVRQGGVLQKVVPDRLDHFEQRLALVTYRASADALDLPELVEAPRYCALEPEARRIYHDLERDLVADIGGGRVTAANALVRVLRLQQVTSGCVPLDEGAEGAFAGQRDAGVARGPSERGSPTQRVSTAKRGLLRDVLEDLPAGEPVVVFTRFHADLDAVHEAAAELGRGSLELSGRRRELEQWQREDAPPVLAVQVQAGGVGVSMVRARYAVWYSLPWGLAVYDQAQARLHRPGQTRSVVTIPLIAAGTVDERIARALTQRREVIGAILDGLAESQEAAA